MKMIERRLFLKSANHLIKYASFYLDFFHGSQAILLAGMGASNIRTGVALPFYFRNKLPFGEGSMDGTFCFI